jgi:hypothetical protein
VKKIFLKKKQKKETKKTQTKKFLLPGTAKTINDFISPSLIKEVIPGDSTITGKATDYWVEVGETVNPVRYYRSFFAQFLGVSTYAGMMDNLYLAEFGDADCDVAIHISNSDQADVLKALQRELSGIESDYYLEKNENKRMAMLDQIRDLREQIARVRREREKVHGVSVQAVVSSCDLQKMQRFASVMLKHFSGKSIFMRAADNRQASALTLATPLDYEPVFRDTYRNMETSCVADLFPFGHGGIRHNTGVILGSDSYDKPVFYDAWHPGLENANMVVFGRSGSGKSFAIKLLILRSVIQGIRHAVIDYQNEFEPLFASIGCPYLKLGSSDSLKINVFDCSISEDKNGRKYVDLDRAVTSALAAVAVMIRAVDPELLAGLTKIRLQEAIKELYIERGISEDPESLFRTEKTTVNGRLTVKRIKKEMPTLYDLYIKLKESPDMKVVAETIKVFTREGPIKTQAIFDGQSSFDLGSAPAFCISLAGLDEEVMKPVGLFIATKWLWENFVLKDIRTPKRIVIDEAQNAINEELAAAWLINAFRMSRKLYTSMCAITQGFEVFMTKPGAEGILKNAPTKLMLHQESLDIDIVKKKFGFSEGEASFLLGAPQGCGILQAGNDSVIVNIEASPEEYAIYTTNPKDFAERG